MINAHPWFVYSSLLLVNNNLHSESFIFTINEQKYIGHHSLSTLFYFETMLVQTKSKLKKLFKILIILKNLLVVSAFPVTQNPAFFTQKKMISMRIFQCRCALARILF